MSNSTISLIVSYLRNELNWMERKINETCKLFKRLKESLSFKYNLTSLNFAKNSAAAPIQRAGGDSHQVSDCRTMLSNWTGIYSANPKVTLSLPGLVCLSLTNGIYGLPNAHDPNCLKISLFLTREPQALQPTHECTTLGSPLYRHAAAIQTV